MRALTILCCFALAGCGGSKPMSTPPPATCGDGTCSAGETASSCCEDCGCPSGQTCTGGLCVDTPRCGDNKCDATESASTCCQDCGCPSGQACTNGACVVTPRCGDNKCDATESASTCCQDCGCPSGQACTNGACVAVEVCGNGTCGNGENENNCCDDCGCSNGYSCVSHSCKWVGTSSMSWSLDDLCNDGENIEVVFFDDADRLAWKPSYIGYGTTTITTNCTTGNLVCIGGRQAGHGYYWGVDIDDSKTCTNCCYFCGAGTVTYNPSCN